MHTQAELDEELAPGRRCYQCRLLKSGFLCLSCRMHICECCFIDHSCCNILTLIQNSSVCPEHHNLTDFFCVTCKRVACFECNHQSRLHENHNILHRQYIKKTPMPQRVQVEDQGPVIDDRERRDIGIIDNTCEDLQEVLRQARDKIEGQVQEHFEEVRVILEAQQADINWACRKIEGLDFENPEHFLQALSIWKNLQRRLLLKAQLHPVVEVNFKARFNRKLGSIFRCQQFVILGGGQFIFKAWYKYNQFNLILMPILIHQYKKFAGYLGPPRNLKPLYLYPCLQEFSQFALTADDLYIFMSQNLGIALKIFDDTLLTINRLDWIRKIHPSLQTFNRPLGLRNTAIKVCLKRWLIIMFLIFFNSRYKANFQFQIFLIQPQLLAMPYMPRQSLSVLKRKYESFSVHAQQWLKVLGRHRL